MSQNTAVNQTMWDFYNLNKDWLRVREVADLEDMSRLFDAILKEGSIFRNITTLKTVMAEIKAKHQVHGLGSQ